MTVRELASHEEFRRYVAFAAEVYRDIPAWVPPDEHHLVQQLDGQGIGAGHTRIQPFWVEDDDGRILATATALIHEPANAHWHEAIGHVLFFEALPGQEAASHRVLDAACGWLREQGCTAARFGFLYGWQLPLTIDAYDEVPTIFHTVNPPYYHRFVKDAGFATESGQVEYIIHFTPELASRYERLVTDAAGGGAVMRPWRLAEAPSEARLFTDVYNAAFGTHWGAPPFSTEDSEGLITGMRDLMVDDFTVFAGVNGATMGAVLALPDLNQAFHRLKTAPGNWRRREIRRRARRNRSRRAAGDRRPRGGARNGPEPGDGGPGVSRHDGPRLSQCQLHHGARCQPAIATDRREARRPHPSQLRGVSPRALGPVTEPTISTAPLARPCSRTAAERQSPRVVE